MSRRSLRFLMSRFVNGTSGPGDPPAAVTILLRLQKLAPLLVATANDLVDLLRLG